MWANLNCKWNCSCCHLPSPGQQRSAIIRFTVFHRKPASKPSPLTPPALLSLSFSLIRLQIDNGTRDPTGSVIQYWGANSPRSDMIECNPLCTATATCINITQRLMNYQQVAIFSADKWRNQVIYEWMRDEVSRIGLYGSNWVPAVAD